MASAGGVGGVLSPVVVRRKKLFLICDWNRKSPSLILASLSSSKPSAAAAASESNTLQVSSSSYSKKKMIEQIDNKRNISQAEMEILEMKEQEEEVRLKDYFSRSEELVISSSSSSSTTTSSNSTSSFPRWFTPLLQSPPSSSSTHHFKHDDSPILLYLPGIDGVGLGLILQYQTLSKIFDVWCLHIPLKDRTSFTELVKLVESTVRLQHSQAPNRPIYLLGHSFGGCLALAVAARNPHIDLVLILANPATSFNRSLFQPEALLPLSIAMLPDQLISRLPYMLIFLSGAPIKMVTASLGKGLSLQDVIGELSQESVAMSSYLSVLSDHLTEEALLWKLNMLKSAASYVNSRLHAVKAQTLILASGNDLLLPSLEEGQRLRKLLPNCEIRTFDDSGHALLLEDEINLASILKGASFYRRGRSRDYVSDYFPPSPSEFEKMYAPHRWLEVATNPVMLSTLESGKIVRGLDGIPSEGPVLFVGYHMMLGFELIPLVSRFWKERNILLRGVGHPMMFRRLGEGQLPDLSNYDTMRCMGAVPVSGANLFKLFKSKSHVLLYPGGMREALHRKGEEYKLFWPEQAEFVRMASRFGATIIPFGSVGEDDVGQLLLDYNDLMKIPYFKNAIRELTEEAVKLRTDATGEVSNQDVHLPILVPKIPGRFYYHFGKPIETKGRIHELKSREKSHELYLEVKSEVEKCLDYLRKKRENDPYRNIVPRLTYQATHGFDAEVPTFDV